MSNELEEALGSNLAEIAPVKAQKPKLIGMPKTTRIVIEENAEIPPTGLFLSVNGRGYMIRPGEPVDVPPGVLEVLDHAIMSQPIVDPASQQITGYRERRRYPYRLEAA